MTKMHINGSESDVVRLFHLDLPPEAVERFATQAGTGEWPLQYALGARQLRSAFVDVVALRDLGEMPLSRYLAEAHQLTGEAFEQMRPRIDALTGHVVVLPSQAFDHVTQDLSIATPLRWIGTFSEVKADARGPALRSASARGGSARPAPEGTPRHRGLAYLLIGLGVLVLLLLAIIFRAG